MEPRIEQILIVDDEVAVRVTLRELLWRRGYDVTVAGSGEEAVRWIEQKDFDLLVVDLKLPGLSGLDVSAYARQHCPTTAIIVLTGTGSLDDAPDAAQAPGVEFLFKTMGPQEVLAHIVAALRQAYTRSDVLIAEKGACRTA